MYSHHQALRKLSSSLLSAVSILVAASPTLTAGRQKVRCEQELQRTSQNHDDEGKKVLIVGCGLTAVLTARQLQQHYCRMHANQKTTTKLQIKMVERATYPAGRFGAQSEFQGAIAKLGAQVLSTVNPDDPRALGGHGVSRDNLLTAQSIVHELLQKNLLELTSNTALGETEERMIWEGLWQHYVAPKGFTCVLKALLPTHIFPEFGVRIDSVAKLDSGRVQVSGLSRSPSSSRPFQRTYDAVILCISAPDALAIQGVNLLLDASSQHVLRGVGYDSRTCEAHFLDPRLRPALAKLFAEATSDQQEQTRPRVALELSLDERCEQVDHDISYISWQDHRHGIPLEDNETPCAVVVHGKAENHGKLPRLLDEKALDLILADATGTPVETIRQCRLHKKGIPWQVSQMIRPMEAVVEDPPPDCSWQCLVGGNLIVAGDFMTQSSFVGCVATADAAAKATLEMLIEDRSI